jgi:hypothetical protein
MVLDWPEEPIIGYENPPKWHHAGSNLCLDFHGDPSVAKLRVFSDGNHHMALSETLQHFYERNPAVEHIFYATTPPGPILQLLRHGSLQLGHLILSATPHVFISPPHVLEMLVREGHMKTYSPFMRNRGSALLVKKGNPKDIHSIADLARNDVRLFLSNPKTETVSYESYVETLKGLAAREGIDPASVFDGAPGPTIVYGERIHHREAPQAVADGVADVAVVYYHLALRYTRIFPDLFEIIPLAGISDKDEPIPENIISETHVGLIGDGGPWGSMFVDLLASETVSDIYAKHGLARE